MNVVAQLASPVRVKSIEAKMIRWRSEAIDDKESLWPLNRMRLMLGGQIKVGCKRLNDDEPDGPETAMYIFNCPSPNCGRLGKDYRHGFTDSANGRYFICNSCDIRLDAYEFLGATLHFVGSFAALVRLAWSLRFRRKPA